MFFSEERKLERKLERKRREELREEASRGSFGLKGCFYWGMRKGANIFQLFLSSRYCLL